MERVLVTGAAGGLGRILRAGLAGWGPVLRLSDIAPMDPAGPGEEVVPCDLADREAVRALVRGCDYIIHLGGISGEAPWERILAVNVGGTQHLYDAAVRAGCRRILFASSNHAIGFHARETRLDDASPFRPDSFYGFSKCAGELLARLYWDRHGIETVSVRIGSCFPEPRDRRMLATWLAPEDFVALARAVGEAPRTGCTVVYGASANRESWWDNAHAGFLGWTPRHSSEPFRAAVEARTPRPDPEDPAVRFQGGGFVTAPLPGD